MSAYETQSTEPATPPPQPAATKLATGQFYQDAAAVPACWQIGDRILDLYEVLAVHESGGMGLVYEAVQESLGRHVALKVLPAHGLMPPSRLERFHREARAAARLHHTNIVPIFGVGEHEGVPYYVMQYIAGDGLDVLLASWRSGKPRRDEERWRFVAGLAHRRRPAPARASGHR